MTISPQVLPDVDWGVWPIGWRTTAGVVVGVVVLVGVNVGVTELVGVWVFVLVGVIVEVTVGVGLKLKLGVIVGVGVGVIYIILPSIHPCVSIILITIFYQIYLKLIYI